MIALYLDACAIVPLFASEPSSSALVELTAAADELIISDYGSGEVASALSRKSREGTLTLRSAKAALAAFDEWAEIATSRVELSARDMRRADDLVRRFDLKLRFPDALHLVICDRIDARLVTRDQLMADAAEVLGLRLLRLP